MVTLDRGELAITVWGEMCKNKKQKKNTEPTVSKMEQRLWV